MAERPNFKTVDDYLAAQPDSARGILAGVRAAIRQAVPAAQEVISYKIPAYTLHGTPVLYFAGWKQHFSLYPVNERVVAAFGAELAAFRLSKGTVRIPLTAPPPVHLIGRIAAFRAQEVAQAARAGARRTDAQSRAPVR